MDNELNILHLRLAIVGGVVIVAFGLISLLGYHNMPVLSFVVGPLISISSWRALKGMECGTADAAEAGFSLEFLRCGHRAGGDALTNPAPPD